MRACYFLQIWLNFSHLIWNLPFDFSLIYSLFRSMLFNIHVFVNFSAFLLLLTSNFISCSRKWYLAWLHSFWICPITYDLSEKMSMCAHQKNVYSVVLARIFYICVRSIGTIVLCKSAIFLLISSLDHCWEADIKGPSHCRIGVYFAF